MAAELLRREVTDRRKALVWWFLGVVAIVAMTVGVWPSFGNNPEFQDVLESYPETMLALFGMSQFDLTDPTNFVDNYLFSFMLPFVTVFYATTFGASTIAGEAESGRLDLVLSYPVSRVRFVLEKAATLVLVLLVFAVFAFLILWGGSVAVGMDASVSMMALSILQMTLLSMAFGFLAMAVGSLSLDKSIANGAAIGVVLAAYLVNSLSELATWLEPLRPLSVWYWYRRGAPIDSVQWADLGVLGGVAVVLLALAVWAFDRRDLAA